MEKGYLSLVLHAHLPYVRHPEYKSFLEEDWLFEAITETYIPLIQVFQRLSDDGVDFRSGRPRRQRDLPGVQRHVPLLDALRRQRAQRAEVLGQPDGGHDFGQLAGALHAEHFQRDLRGFGAGDDFSLMLVLTGGFQASF